MGQGQSAEDTGATQDEIESKTDFYELLGVERTASEDEIKKAYRRKALELHPDRNYGNVENATRLFAEIQSAYEVLADPQERAWYDSHRDAILRGTEAKDGDGEQYSYNIRMTTADEILKLMLKFNARVQFTDSPSGFHGGLRDIFERLAKEEEVACQWEDQEIVEYPQFGHKDDNFEDVVRPFYAAWNGFATKKTFSWKDAYRLSEAPDRRIRRLMEKENKRIRGEAIQEFNDAVRSLVAFVRKRDPRYQENLQSEAQRQKTLRDAAAAQAARARAANQAKLKDHVLPEWAKSSQNAEEEISGGEESSSEEEHFECVVCNKTFKSEKQFEAHERSKKHVKNLQGLKRKMRLEDQTLNLHSEDNENGIAEDVEEGPEPTAPEAIEQELDGVTPQTADDNTDAPKARSESGSEVAHEDDRASKSPLKSPEANTAISGASTPSDEDGDYAPRETVAERLTSNPLNPTVDEIKDLDDSLAASSLGTDSEEAPAKKPGKAKQKRAKKAAQQAAGNQTSSELRCAKCQAGFPSKNQLFKHIQESGHAQPVPKAAKAAKKGKR